MNEIDRNHRQTNQSPDRGMQKVHETDMNRVYEHCSLNRELPFKLRLRFGFFKYKKNKFGNQYQSTRTSSNRLH